MSWIVESLLLDRYRIRENIEVVNNRTQTIEYDFDNDDYNDLLILESKIESLYKEGVLDLYELEILNAVVDTGNFNQVARDLEMSSWTVSKYFHSVCEKISFYLGGSFTDAGYTDYIAEKHNLNTEQAERMVEYMKSVYKHKLLKVSNEEGEDSE